MLNSSRKKLAVLISGRGSNMEAILEASKTRDYPAEIAIVIADSATAKGLETAREAGITALSVERKDYSSKAEHEKAIVNEIETANVDIIVLAGFMRLLSQEFVEAFHGRLINIHPSLLPEYKGLDTHKRAIDAGSKQHGCTVHFVNAEMDGGRIIARASLDILPSDTVDSLSQRVLKLEHKLYPAVVALVARGSIKLQGADLEIDSTVNFNSDGTVEIET